MLWVLQKTKVALGNMLVFEYNSIKGEWPPILWEAIWGYATDDLKEGYKVVGAPLYKNIVHQPYLANLLVFIPLVERLIGLPDTVIPVILEGWPSGLRHLSAKEAGVFALRKFESFTFRLFDSLVHYIDGEGDSFEKKNKILQDLEEYLED